MKDKLLKVVELALEVNENTDHDVMLTFINRTVRVTVFLNGFSKVKEPVHISARLDDRFVCRGGVDCSTNDIITYLNNLLKEELMTEKEQLEQELFILDMKDHHNAEDREKR